MKYAAIIAILMAIGAAGCGKSESDQAEANEKTDKSVAGQVNKAVEDITSYDATDRSARAPGFFNRRSSGTRADLKEDPGDFDTDDVPAVQPAATPEPVKRPEPKLVKPNAEAERKLRLAKLYIDNAASATSAIRSKFLHDKAVTILKEIISKHAQDPAAPQAKKLLAQIETAE
jgi:hypothetical protein